MRLYADVVRVLGRTRAFAWVAPRVLLPLDLRFAGRRRSVTSLGTDFPLCYLTTKGRRTGEPRIVPLLHVSDPPCAVVIGSNWGRRRDPAWALNLAAEPEATLSVAGKSRPVRARRATAAERERYWRQALRFWPGYESYRRRAGREMPMFVLEPAGPQEP